MNAQEQLQRLIQLTEEKRRVFRELSPEARRAEATAHLQSIGIVDRAGRMKKVFR